MFVDFLNCETFDNVNKKISFIHIPKTGGSSIQKINKDNKIFNIYDHSIYNNKNLLKNDYNIKFTIVRNPYARLVSAFFYLKNGGGQNELDLSYKKKLDKYNTFDEFVENLNYNIIYEILHLVPQFEYLIDNNELLYTNILYLENINNDFKNFCFKYDLKNLNFPITNTSKHDNYKYYINKKDTRNKIYNLYKKDFELLNYKY